MWSSLQIFAKTFFPENFQWVDVERMRKECFRLMNEFFLLFSWHVLEKSTYCHVYYYFIFKECANGFNIHLTFVSLLSSLSPFLSLSLLHFFSFLPKKKVKMRTNNFHFQLTPRPNYLEILIVHCIDFCATRASFSFYLNHKHHSRLSLSLQKLYDIIRER